MSSSSSAVAEGKDVIVTAPIVGSIVKSPLIVQGKARGSWFFEGSLPIVITDTNDNIIAVAPAEALGEWMTIDYVDFTATITFSTKATSGFIIVKKNNPSGLPENDSQVKIPVTF